MKTRYKWLKREKKYRTKEIEKTIFFHEISSMKIFCTQNVSIFSSYIIICNLSDGCNSNRSKYGNEIRMKHCTIIIFVQNTIYFEIDFELSIESI